MSDERVVVAKTVGLSKIFCDFWGRPKAKAVNDVDLEIRQGEVVGLLGPNGSGKSTTVKLLLGLLYPTGGQISVFGRSPRDVMSKKEIGYLPEETNLYKYLTAEETLRFFGSLFDLSRADLDARIAQLLDMVGLRHAANRRVGEFSKGMARRVGLAQAMLNDPAFLILDEPTSGLDPIGCREVKDLICKLKSRGKTILITSHLLSDMQDVCDRVVILYGGKVVASGALDELLVKSDVTQISLSGLAPDKLDKVSAALRAEIPSGNLEITHPTQSLETYFLDVVAKAREASVETSGASDEGEIADYLRGDAESKLESLTVKPEISESVPETPRPTQDDSAVEADLSRLDDTAAVPEPTEETSTEPEESLDDVNKVLDDMFGKK